VGRVFKITLIVVSLFFGANLFLGNAQSEEGVQEGKPQAQASRPFMSSQGLEKGEKQPPNKKPLDISDPRNQKVAEIPEKKPNWFERTFWLSFKSWINERNRNDPNEDSRIENKK
jgi:hypothetical protein